MCSQKTGVEAELQHLRQQHQLALLQLSDVKENYQKIKKLNTTILENMMKEPDDFLREIKVIIDGDLYSHRIIQLEAELERLRGRIAEEVQAKVRQIISGINIEKNKVVEHDCQNCEQCRKFWSKCPNCSKINENIGNLERMLIQKNSLIDSLRLELQSARSQFQIQRNRQYQQKHDKNSQLEQVNKILKANIKDLQSIVREHEQNSHRINSEWQNQYQNLNEHYQQAIAQLQQYKSYIDTRQKQKEWDRQRQRDQSQAAKKNNMMKQIQNIMGELGRKSLSNAGPKPNTNKLNSNASRIVQDSDFSNFSIKDAINRPNQFSYF